MNNTWHTLFEGERIEPPPARVKLEDYFDSDSEESFYEQLATNDNLKTAHSHIHSSIMGRIDSIADELKKLRVNPDEEMWELLAAYVRLGFTDGDSLSGYQLMSRLWSYSELKFTLKRDPLEILYPEPPTKRIIREQDCHGYYGWDSRLVQDYGQAQDPARHAGYFVDWNDRLHPVRIRRSCCGSKVVDWTDWSPGCWIRLDSTQEWGKIVPYALITDPVAIWDAMSEDRFSRGQLRDALRRGIRTGTAFKEEYKFRTMDQEIRVKWNALVDQLVPLYFDYSDKLDDAISDEVPKPTQMVLPKLTRRALKSVVNLVYEYNRPQCTQGDLIAPVLREQWDGYFHAKIFHVPLALERYNDETRGFIRIEGFKGGDAGRPERITLLRPNTIKTEPLESLRKKVDAAATLSQNYALCEGTITDVIPLAEYYQRTVVPLETELSALKAVWSSLISKPKQVNFFDSPQYRSFPSRLSTFITRVTTCQRLINTALKKAEKARLDRTQQQSFDDAAEAMDDAAGQARDSRRLLVLDIVDIADVLPDVKIQVGAARLYSDAVNNQTLLDVDRIIKKQFKDAIAIKPPAAVVIQKVQEAEALLGRTDSTVSTLVSQLQAEGAVLENAFNQTLFAVRKRTTEEAQIASSTEPKNVRDAALAMLPPLQVSPIDPQKFLEIEKRLSVALASWEKREKDELARRKREEEERKKKEEEERKKRETEDAQRRRREQEKRAQDEAERRRRDQEEEQRRIIESQPFFFDIGWFPVEVQNAWDMAKSDSQDTYHNNRTTAAVSFFMGETTPLEPRWAMDALGLIKDGGVVNGVDLLQELPNKLFVPPELWANKLRRKLLIYALARIYTQRNDKELRKCLLMLRFPKGAHGWTGKEVLVARIRSPEVPVIPPTGPVVQPSMFQWEEAGMGGSCSWDTLFTAMFKLPQTWLQERIHEATLVYPLKEDGCGKREANDLHQTIWRDVVYLQTNLSSQLPCLSLSAWKDCLIGGENAAGDDPRGLLDALRMFYKIEGIGGGDFEQNTFSEAILKNPDNRGKQLLVFNVPNASEKKGQTDYEMPLQILNGEFTLLSVASHAGLFHWVSYVRDPRVRTWTKFDMGRSEYVSSEDVPEILRRGTSSEQPAMWVYVRTDSLKKYEEKVVAPQSNPTLSLEICKAELLSVFDAPEKFEQAEQTIRRCYDFIMKDRTLPALGTIPRVTYNGKRMPFPPSLLAPNASLNSLPVVWRVKTVAFTLLAIIHVIDNGASTQLKQLLVDLNSSEREIAFNEAYAKGKGDEWMDIFRGKRPSQSVVEDLFPIFDPVLKSAYERNDLSSFSVPPNLLLLPGRDRLRLKAWLYAQQGGISDDDKRHALVFARPYALSPVGPTEKRIVRTREQGLPEVFPLENDAVEAYTTDQLPLDVPEDVKQDARRLWIYLYYLQVRGKNAERERIARLAGRF